MQELYGLWAETKFNLCALYRVYGPAVACAIEIDNKRQYDADLEAKAKKTISDKFESAIKEKCEPNIREALLNKGLIAAVCVKGKCLDKKAAFMEQQLDPQDRTMFDFNAPEDKEAYKKAEEGIIALIKQNIRSSCPLNKG
jgi:hypothetical protein